MIESLRIENLGTINHAELVFSPGFTVITGETGAGKTMLLTSLNWLLGAQPRAALVTAGRAQAVVEGTFLVDAAAAAVVAEAGGAVEDGVVEAARIVPAQSRSKAHLGGRTVPAATLGAFGADLVSVHGQATQSRLRGEKAQREAVDDFGGKTHQVALRDYDAAWEEWCAAKAALEEWEENLENRQRRREVLERLSAEFSSLAPEDGEFAELTAKISRLSNVENLRENATAALVALDDDSEMQVGANALVDIALRALEKAAAEDNALAEVAEMVASASYSLGEATRELGIYLRDLNADPQALQEALSRRAAFTDLSLKVAVEPAALGTAWQEVETELGGIQDGEEHRQHLMKAVETATVALQAAAAKLHAQREKTAASLSKAINRELKGLNMPETRVEVTVTAKEPAASGADTIEFLMQPHAKASLLPLAEAASGGELSRIMLALEVCLAAAPGTAGARGAATSRGASPDNDATPKRTFVFDEVDAGIGGQAGIEVGKRLARLAKDYQVIVVTHLAQVAAFANLQIQVSKTKGESRIEPLDSAERREELARMISGSQLTDTALRHADELLQQANVAQSEV